MKTRRAVLLVAFLCACSETAAPPAFGPATQLVVVSGGSQEGVVGEELSLPVVVELRDAAGRPVPDAPVVFQAVAGEGVIIAASSVTNAAGQASTRWQLGTSTSAEHILEARTVVTTGIPLLSARISAQSRPGAVASLRILQGTGWVSLVGLPLTLQVAAADRFGNAITSPPIFWSTSDSLVVSVNSAGTILPRTLGTATLTAAVGDKSATIAVTVLPPVLVNPSGLVATFDSAAWAVNLSWLDQSGATSHRIERRSTTDPAWKVVGEVPHVVGAVGKSTWRDSGFVTTLNHHHDYRVSACFGDCGVPSSVSVDVPIAPWPEVETVSLRTVTEVQLQWKTRHPLASGYIVTWKGDWQSTYPPENRLVVTGAANGAVVSGLFRGNTYWFNVQSYFGNDPTRTSHAAGPFLVTMPAETTQPYFLGQSAVVSGSSVHLSARFVANRYETEVYFEWSSSPTFTNALRVPGATIPPGPSIVTVSADVTNVSAGTYYFRTVDRNAGGGGTYFTVTVTVP